MLRHFDLSETTANKKKAIRTSENQKKKAKNIYKNLEKKYHTYWFVGFVGLT